MAQPFRRGKYAVLIYACTKTVSRAASKVGILKLNVEELAVFTLRIKKWESI